MAPRTALLVIDMQVFFESMTTTALPKIITLCRHFSKTSAPIIFTQHGHSKAELTTDPSPNQLVRKWGSSGSIAAGSREWELIDGLRQFVPKFPPKPLNVGESFPPAEEKEKFPKLMAKNTYDGFINTNLAKILETSEIEPRSAFNRGYETWLVRDACGSANKKQHEAGLRGFGFAFGEVLTTSEVLSRI
ncbi:hypothetical protein LTR99_004727 [Exophiala xenobiotica]|uniref:Isochorismatase-like domain-containing protein n=1 Tax=Vermiconidia calcicola TaxID=1690605 RepID=A0AAV9QGE5_9PEZI|nr:hypothetical protein LTR92_000480 [Exophiala xenobiotica]KAK5531714.1 hypothetical protein LTR23_009830 [Chaetothyriales sp. CCFEE 6169]KAK5540008.1 hypothetical protein LTR25_003713 [Vermiconidia calcicola]KAK5240420.1 hypothetical protein LTS06_012462 [Exophiala xenobiotica]KAK5293653.1 hypothetical protein LTR14_004544 [Exophiala xenobiotica]